MLASIAAAPITGSIPIATKAIVLPVIGLSSADIALILAVDWLTDRLTTSTNVWACCIACDVVQHLSRDELEPVDVLEETDEKCTDVTGKTNSVAIEIAAEEETITETKEDIQNIA